MWKGSTLSEMIRPGSHSAMLLAVPPSNRGTVVEERLLDLPIQLESEIDGPADGFRPFVQAKVGLRCADQLKGEIQPVDKDEMADAEAAAGFFGEQPHLPQITLEPGVRRFESQSRPAPTSRPTAAGTMDEIQPFSPWAMNCTRPPSTPP